MLQVVAGLLGAAAVSAAAYRAALHVLYGKVEVERQRHEARTADGARIALYRLAPEEQRWAEPVLFCHGLGANRFDLDFVDPAHSVAAAFAREGFDCWVLELRGAGASLPPPDKTDWSFDDYLEQDVPAAVDRIRELTGQRQVHWVGHSMGGMLLYAYLLGPRSEDVRCGVTLGSPARFTGGAERFHLEIRLAVLLRFLRRVHVRAFSRWTVPLAGRIQHRFSRSIANWQNVDPGLMRRAQYLATSNLAPSLVRQFLRWVREGSFGSRDGALCWTERLPQIRQPLLVVAGAGDRLVPAEDVRHAYEALGSAEKEYLELSRKAGFACDYGHVDLVFGRAAPRVVYPRLVEFVRRHARPARA